MPDVEKDAPQENRRAVLEVFGLTLEISNPRLAELLTMDAKTALVTDMRDLIPHPGATPFTPDEVAQAMPDILVSAPTPHDEDLVRLRRDFRQRAEAVGKALGFETRSDGLWVSPTGVQVLTRALDRPLSLAAASHYVGEMSQLHDQRDDAAETSVLFVVGDQQTADVFKVAIRQRRLYSVMRTASIEHLEEMRALMESEKLDHTQAVMLLAPVANIDVGELLSVLHAQNDKIDFSLDVF